MMGYEWWEVALFGIIAVIVVGLMLLLVDSLWTETKIWEGVVIDRAYTASQTSTGVGYGITSGGQTGVVVTTSTSKEEWNLIVRVDREVVSAKTSPERWATSKKDDNVKVEQHVGRIFGFTHLLWVQ